MAEQTEKRRRYGDLVIEERANDSEAWELWADKNEYGHPFSDFARAKAFLKENGEVGGEYRIIRVMATGLKVKSVSKLVV